MTDEPQVAADRRERWLGSLAARFAAMEESADERRAETIERWVREAAERFADAPVQAYVPVLVEHIVRDQVSASAPRVPVGT